MSTGPGFGFCFSLPIPDPLSPLELHCLLPSLRASAFQFAECEFHLSSGTPTKGAAAAVAAWLEIGSSLASSPSRILFVLFTRLLCNTHALALGTGYEYLLGREREIAESRSALMGEVASREEERLDLDLCSWHIIIMQIRFSCCR